MKTILVGGCFDILHVAHIRFLKEAKSLGDKLIVLLESDKRITQKKGKGRPINSQKIRAEMLEGLSSVDEVILLPADMDSKKYDFIVKKIKPDIIATTKGDPNIEFKKRAAKLVGAQVIGVIPLVKGYSTKIFIEKIKQS